jgi:ligand-binding sensor domain-containing protein
LKDRDGTVWVGCEHGVDRFDKVTETFRHYPIEGEDADGPPVIVLHVSQDHTGALWLSTSNGLYRLDPATGRTSPYRHDPLNSSSLSSNVVKFAAEDSSHRFWVATGVSGVSLEEFDRESGKVVLRVPVTSDRLGVADVGVAFYEDHFGVFWIIYTTIGHGGGLGVLDRATDTVTRYSIYDRNSRRELAGGVQAVVEDQNRGLWFATSEGLLRFNREQRMFYRYRHHPDDPNSLPEDRVISLCADGEGNVWAGLHALTPAFFRSGTASFTPLLRRPSNPNSFGETFVNAIYEDQQGLLWIGTTGALIRIDRKSGQYTPYPPPGLALTDDIIAITDDRSGGLWIGSFGTHLTRLRGSH